MMSQRFNLFYAGFTASLPNLYFSRQRIKESFSTLDNSELQPQLSNYFKSFEKDKEEQASHLVSALALAKQFDIHDFDTPLTASDYFTWIEDLVNEFEMKFPMGRIEYYYFLFARRIAELIKNMELVKTYIDMQLICKNTLDQSSKIESHIKDCEFIVFKLMAPAALLSSEPRQNCFNNLYKEMCENIAVFKELDLTNATEEQLIKLKGEADHFSLLSLNGFKNCVGVLKEL